LQAILDAPDPATRDGIRDRAMLHLAVCAGLRVSETDRVEDRGYRSAVNEHPCSWQGTAERTLPLWKTTAAALRAWLAVRGQVRSARGVRSTPGRAAEPMGFAYLLKQHAATAARQQPGLNKKRISPHVLRHTCAMIILQATQDIRKVSSVVGSCHSDDHRGLHAGRSDGEARCLGSIVPPHLRRGAFQPSRQADRAPQTCIVMVSQTGGDWRTQAIKSPPTPHYKFCP